MDDNVEWIDVASRARSDQFFIRVGDMRRAVRGRVSFSVTCVSKSAVPALFF